MTTPLTRARREPPGVRGDLGDRGETSPSPAAAWRFPRPPPPSNWLGVRSVPMDAIVGVGEEVVMMMVAAAGNGMNSIRETHSLDAAAHWCWVVVLGGGER